MSLTHARAAAGLILLTALATGCGAAASVASSVVHHTAPAAGQAAPPACSLLKPADVLAVASTFPHDTITIDGHNQQSAPPTSECGYNQKGVFTASGGITTTMSGDQWAQLTVVADGASYDYNPVPGATIKGLGDGAYWDAGSNTVVVKVGQNVLQVVDNVPANVGSTASVGAAYRQAAQALAAKVLARM
ncbi:MAG TPA: hypothetical protein VIX86_11855 [Streptosporangiaceae bacterium]